MKTVAAFLLLMLIAAGAGAYLMNRRAHALYQGYSGPEQFVDVTSGAGTKAIGDRLVAAGVVRDALTFRVALWLSGSARRLKAGEYRFDRPTSALDVIAKIARGDVYVVGVTFPEGLTIGEMAKIFETHGFGARSAFEAAANDPSAIQRIDPAATNLEGYLFPDTYLVPRRVDAPQLVRAMVDRFEKALTPDLVAAARARGLSVRQLVTLASIVEKETGRSDERALVSAVYANRLKIGMPLQCDPTVIYALMRAGSYNGNIRRDDLAIDSPYNTYRVPGLPPGPISAPGRDSLEAAARPAAADVLYFVSRNDGSHEFARTLEEHNRNVQRFQVQYFRNKAGRH